MTGDIKAFHNTDIRIKPVDKANWTDFETLFESRGGPGYCWCMTWRMTRDELKNNNRARRKNFIKQRIFTESPVGLLAYLENQAIVWCSIAPRDTYQGLGGDESREKRGKIYRS